MIPAQPALKQAYLFDEKEVPLAMVKKSGLKKKKVPVSAKAKKVKLATAPKPPAVARKNKEIFENALTMSKRQREISISEFFQKNRHLLGFDNPRKALLTTVKEAVDNALDACEEAGILPEITVEIRPVAGQEDRYTVMVRDNGPGIVAKQVPNVFGKLLYGSKFHRLKMSRGQQGIGISAAGMYGQMTTGKPVRITSRPGKGKSAHYFEISIDTTKNVPVILKETENAEFANGQGTEVTIELSASFQRGRASVDEYLFQTALANPHLTLRYAAPDGQKATYERATNDIPKPAREIKPHPKGIELGTLIKMAKDTKARQVSSFLQHDFSRVSGRVSQEICATARIPPNARPGRIADQEAEALFKAIQQAKIMNPPLDCLSPIGEAAVVAGLQKQVKADFYCATTRPPAVYRGNPFQMEVGLAWGGEMEPEGLARILRFANRVPLLYQPGACAMNKAVLETAWRNYKISQSKGAPPSGPLLIFIHMASVWVPFTSEAKEAVAHYLEIVKEIKLALQECGRKLLMHINARTRTEHQAERRSIFERYINEVVSSCAEMARINQDEMRKNLRRQAGKRTHEEEAAAQATGPRIVIRKGPKRANARERLDSGSEGDE